jgi:serine/threonine-protein kinase
VSIGPGAILGGKYRLEESIGRGGMGEVFEATNQATAQRVAVKVVNRSFADTMLMERLRREAEAARRVQSEFVPRLYDVDKTPDGELFLVMELLYGETLSARMRRRGGVLSWEEVWRIGDDVLRGLIDAHAAGVIHRDLKPGNIFIEAVPGRRERARILDFGVCKLDVHDGESLTTTGEAVGTIAYMAPEQIRGASRVDERADLYAFAMVVFETLCGRLAYDASGSIALIACKLEKPARSIRDLGRMPIPEGLEVLLGRCLARRPADRPASATELLRDWQGLGAPTVTPVPLPQRFHAGDSPTEAGMTAAPTLQTRASRRRSRVALLVAAAALLASCGVLVVGLRLHAEPPAAVAAAAAGVAAAAPSPSPSSPPSPAAPTTAVAAAADPSAVASHTPALEIAPVVLAASADAGTSRPSRARPSKRTWTASPAPRHPSSTEPQIVAEPRY